MECQVSLITSCWFPIVAEILVAVSAAIPLAAIVSKPTASLQLNSTGGCYDDADSDNHNSNSNPKPQPTSFGKGICALWARVASSGPEILGKVASVSKNEMRKTWPK